MTKPPLRHSNGADAAVPTFRVAAWILAMLSAPSLLLFLALALLTAFVARAATNQPTS